MVIYNDRVFCWEKMKAIDPTFDSEITTDKVKEYVDNDIRNVLAQQELEHYQEHKKFAYVHPLTKRHKLHHELHSLRINNPERFMDELINADKNVSRYKSAINKGKYKDDEEKRKWQQHIDEYKEKLEVMRKVLSE